MEKTIYHLHALTPLHVGAESGAGIIDQPLVRERATHLPLVPGSAMKGVWRDELRDPKGTLDSACKDLFGPETERAGDHAGAMMCGDARLLCLPVRSFSGTFAWTTCPMVLRRYSRERSFAGIQESPAVPVLAQESTAIVGDPASALAEPEGDKSRIYLEDLDFGVEPLSSPDTKLAAAWATAISDHLFSNMPVWQDLFRKRFLVLHDNVFDFLAETATEVNARIRTRVDSRTVARGGLWYEENLPAEAILWGVLAFDRSRSGSNLSSADMKQEFTDRASRPEHAHLQVGGHAGTGRGRLRFVLG